MNVLSWYNYANSTADSFKLYRSVPGIVFPFAVLSTNCKFRFSATSWDIQEITVDTATIDTAVASLNSSRGVSAKKSNSGVAIIVRLLASLDARLKLYPCTLLEDIGLKPSIIVPELSFQQLATSSYVSGTDPYTYTDMDGDNLDSYYITSVTAGSESSPSVIKAPLLPGVSYCMVEARFTNAQGRPVKSVEMIVELAILDHLGFTSNKLKVLSDAYGRISVPLIQNQQYVIHIPAIGYNQFILVPATPFMDLTSYTGTTGPEFSPFGDVP